VGKRLLQIVAVLLVVLTVAPVVGAKAARLDRNEAIRLAQKEVARTTQVAATSQVVGSGQWTVTLRQDGAAASDRIYVMLNAQGEVVEEGWLKNGILKPVQVVRERAVLIAERSIGSSSQVRKAGLVLTPSSLNWEIVGKGRDGKVWTVVVDAFSGKVVNRQAGGKEPELITKNRAIAIASAEVKYRPRQVEAELTQFRGTTAWKVELAKENGRYADRDVFYIDATDGKILAHRSQNVQPDRNISKDQAISIALKRVGVPCKVQEAKLDNWQGQDVWVITLVEEKNPWAWHIIVLQADGSFRQQVQVQ
jgi:uncharacterized membrane protein YkoI